MNKKYMNIIKNENGESRKVDIKRVKTKKKKLIIFSKLQRLPVQVNSISLLRPGC